MTVEKSTKRITRKGVDELRLAVATMRRALSESLEKNQPVDAAQVLNDTTDVAMTHRCYLKEP